MTQQQQQMPTKLGRYEIRRELGKGAMGIVYEGFDPNIGRRVAIKTARRDTLEKSGRADELMARFLREARAAGALNSPNIITIYDADEEEGTAFIAMEYVAGSDLGHTIKQKNKYAPEEVVEIAATICEALALAHRQGIVHRDVKPSNIMLLDDGTIKVADFGIARVSDSNLTQEGSMIGTPHYMSPEQFMGHKVDGRSDLFSVGIILYEMLTGEKPFPGEQLSTVMHSVLKSSPIEPAELNFAVNPTLSKVVMKSLAKDPKRRYADGIAMARALRESLKEHPDPAVTQVGEVSGADVAATVATAAPVDNQKTVLMDSRSATAYQVGGKIVAGSAAALDADLSARTVAGEVKFGEQGKGVKKNVVMYAGAGIGALLVAGLGLMLLTGEQPANNSGATGADGGATATNSPYIESATVNLWYTSDVAAYETIESKSANPTSDELIAAGFKSGTAATLTLRWETGNASEAEVAGPFDLKTTTHFAESPDKTKRYNRLVVTAKSPDALNPDDVVEYTYSAKPGKVAIDVDLPFLTGER